MGRGSQRTKIGILAATVTLLGAVSGVSQTLGVTPTTTVAPTLPTGQPPSATQAPNSSLTASIGLTTKVELDSNPNLSGGSSNSRFRISEDLKFSLRSETRTQLFDLTAVSGLRYSNTIGGGSKTDAVDPKFTLRYFRESANSDLDIRANYREGDVTSSFDIDPSTAVFLVVDTGTLKTGGVSLDFSLGKNAPLGLDASIAYDQKDYSGTTDPSLFDEEKLTTSLTANAQLSQVTQASLSVSNIDYDSTDPTSLHTETYVYTAALSHELRQGLTIDGSLGFREKDTFAGGPATTLDGAFGSLDLTQARVNGDIFGGLSFDSSGIADRTSLSFGRSLDLPDGTLSARLTATDVSGTGTQLFGNVNYFRQLPSGSLSVDLDRTLTTNQQNEDIAFTQLGVNLLRQVTSVSNLNLSMNVSRSEDGGAGAAPTKNRATFTASYSRPLTSDWDWSVGYRHRRSSATGSSLATSDAVFMTLSRNIQFGF